MGSSSFYFLEGALAATYILLLLLRPGRGAWVTLAVFFIVVAGALRYSISVESVADFRPYFESFREVKYGGLSAGFLIEPYRLVLFESVLLFGDFDDLTQIGIIYYFHFIVITGFFIWLAYDKVVSFETKLILFLAFYPPMAFVWIRSGMAYAASCFLFLTVTSRRYRVVHYLLPFIHSSVLPLLVALKIRNLSVVLKGMILLLVVVLGYFVVESSYIQYMIGKFEYYSGSADRRTSNDLVLFHVANILAFGYLAVINSKFRRNFAVLALMSLYVIMYVVSPVIGLRVFPLVLIASIVQQLSFPRYRALSFLVCAAYLPVYFVRFDQVVSW